MQLPLVRVVASAVWQADAGATPQPASLATAPCCWYLAVVPCAEDVDTVKAIIGATKLRPLRGKRLYVVRRVRGKQQAKHSTKEPSVPQQAASVGQHWQG